MGYLMLGYFLVLYLRCTNLQRIHDEKLIEDSCKSEVDYSNNIEKLRILIMEQSNKLTGYGQKFENLESNCDNLTKEFLSFRQLQTNITREQHDELETLRKDNQEMKNRLILLEEAWTAWNATKGESEHHDFVGFTVMLGAQILPYKDSIIKPSRIVTQYPNINFFSNSGEFVCFKDGIYVFFLHLVTESQSNGAWIYKNLQPMTLTWQDGPGVSTVVSGTTSLTVELRVRDRISIRSYKNNLSVNETSVWSGHLISQKSNEYIHVAMQSLLKRGNSKFLTGTQMISDIGNANYSLMSGNFFCTKSGMYKIDINAIIFINSTNDGVRVYLNDIRVPSLHAWHSQKNAYSSSSTAEILNLNIGDKITLDIAHDGTLNNFSNFAVYLLRPLFDVDMGFSCKLKLASETYVTCTSPTTTLNSSGYFACKEEGYYYLSINLLTSSLRNGIQFYKNEKAMTFVWIETKLGTWSSASTSLVLYLKVGDLVTFRKMRLGSMNIDHASRIVIYKVFP
ncbi:uncharacterized protein LOC134232362 [Saccostrea cucullata]|uniref:uncharacterized protein LOC134232362 n=1 Tax=Saccostrea cuccullata TaxID=36930 RepID=UPI002ED146B3